MKIFKKIALALLAVLIVMQFIRPDKNLQDGDVIADFRAETKPTQEVEAILERACFDCHTNNTKYPWYAEVAPVSYWLADHVDEGKGHLNLSDWKSYTVKRKDHKLEELGEEVEKKHMPLDSYLWVHDEAVLSDSDMQIIVDWVNQARSNYKTALSEE
ncbi:MAG: heme-binding domain-containing protein [Bacteroidetes bacterium]|nr:heme-binding domain-containing protein [Bacteroidota bacterium]